MTSMNCVRMASSIPICFVSPFARPVIAASHYTGKVDPMFKESGPSLRHWSSHSRLLRTRRWPWDSKLDCYFSALAAKLESSSFCFPNGLRFTRHHASAASPPAMSIKLSYIEDVRDGTKLW